MCWGAVAAWGKQLIVRGVARGREYEGEAGKDPLEETTTGTEDNITTTMATAAVKANSAAGTVWGQGTYARGFDSMDGKHHGIRRSDLWQQATTHLRPPITQQERS